MASLVTFSTIAYQCLLSGNERPRMKMVVKQLQKALANQLAQSRCDGDFAAHLRGQSRLLESSSQSSPASSSSRPWKYDVFISFGEEDTRKTFVDYLYVALLHKGIFAYKDEGRLPWEETISPSRIKTIEESRIAIIVFSRNYVGSSWCLDELAFIMKNKEKGKIVIPIFYDVDPSYVRKQKKYYEEALAMHESSNNIKVKSWRQALTMAGNLAGWEPRQARGQEAEYTVRMVDQIAKQLLSLMQRWEASAEANASPVLIGLETRMQKLGSLLKVGQVVYIWLEYVECGVVVSLLLYLVFMMEYVMSSKVAALSKMLDLNQECMA
ncbi:TMV resistance protein N-like [Bidens hawaiensis]|uniref:TMV resistance protein N-like n=1 Tax=Bidens hawaiensis TaxID=980011 RepID=UPI00404B1EEF